MVEAGQIPTSTPISNGALETLGPLGGGGIPGAGSVPGADGGPGAGGRPGAVALMAVGKGMKAFKPARTTE
jgi:hypothetical protein